MGGPAASGAAGPELPDLVVLEVGVAEISQGRPLEAEPGPEFIATALLRWLQTAEIDTAFIDPGKPWQNGTDESFNGKFRNECLSLEWFRNRMEAKIGIERWRPLMSFGGPQVDQIGPTGQFPTTSQITGLFANALGCTHRDVDRLQTLQRRLSFASALVHEGEELQDYQTVDLGQTHLRHPAWTTRGRTEHRDGGPDARYGTHIRFRRYRANASVLVAVSLSPADDAPTLSHVSDALVTPARPLCIGRKPCLPSTRLLVGIVDEASSVTDALVRVPGTFADRWSFIGGTHVECKAEWPVADERALSSTARLATRRVIDRRDWRNQLHGGERVVAHGTLALNAPDAPAEGGAS